MRTCTSLIVVSLSGLLISCGGGEAGDSGIESLSGSSDTASANTTGIDTDVPKSATTTGETGEDDVDPPIFDLGATPDLGGARRWLRRGRIPVRDRQLGQHGHGAREPGRQLPRLHRRHPEHADQRAELPRRTSRPTRCMFEELSVGYMAT